jgi:hypothetical protein
MAAKERSESASARPSLAAAWLSAAFLVKLAKHLALIACFMIIGAASGRVAASETGIFLTVVAAALLHSIGRVLERRLPPGARFPRRGP